MAGTADAVGMAPPTSTKISARLKNVGTQFTAGCGASTAKRTNADRPFRKLILAGYVFWIVQAMPHNVRHGNPTGIYL